VQTIQRPSDAQVELLWRAPGDPFPINSQLLVGEQECVVATLNGVVLGVIPPGNHWLHPQPFPFLGSAVSGPHMASELWFVRTSPTRGFQFGGSLDVIDAETGEQCTLRVMGTYSVGVSDPRRLVVMCMGGTTREQITSWVSGIVLDRAKEAADLGDVLSMLRPDTQRTLAERIRGGTEQLESSGLSLVQVDIVGILVSDEDRERLTAAKAAQAQEAMAAARSAPAPLRCAACGTANDRGHFCTACGHRF
jgi:membrane protease subunit (stomatin/prohibitin family)